MSPHMPMRVSCWCSAATPSSAARSLPNRVSRARWGRRSSTSRSVKDPPRLTRFNSSTERELSATLARLLPAQPDPEPSRQFLRELPGDAPRARAACGRPFQRFTLELFFGKLDAEMAAITLHHREILILAAAVKAEPQSEAVRERDLLLDRLAGIDRGRTLVFHHVARQQMPAVGGGVQDHIVGPALDAAFQHRLQRLVGGVVAVERQVVAEHDEMKARAAQPRHQQRQALDILAMDLDQFQPL